MGNWESLSVDINALIMASGLYTHTHARVREESPAPHRCPPPPQVCSGLSGAVRSLRCGEGDVAEVFQEDELALLYEACPSDEARCVH